MLASARTEMVKTIMWPRVPSARPALVAKAANAALGAHRLQLGLVGIDFCSFANERSVQLTPTDTMVHIVVPSRGAMMAATPTDQFGVDVGTALLLVRREPTGCAWLAGAEGLIVHVPRLLIHARAFATSGAPSRLAGTRLVFDHEQAGSTFGAAIEALGSGHPASDRTDIQAVDLGISIVAGLVDVLQASSAGMVGFALSRSVKRAIDHLRAEPDAHVSPEQLARIAGVTLVRLRRNFKECLGVTLAAFLQQERLGWARRRLASSAECRSIAELADACDMSSTGGFTRAYHRRFQETPTQTRTRAFALQR